MMDSLTYLNSSPEAANLTKGECLDNVIMGLEDWQEYWWSTKTIKRKWSNITSAGNSECKFAKYNYE